jgi:hypothetical protein
MFLLKYLSLLYVRLVEISGVCTLYCTVHNNVIFYFFSFSSGNSCTTLQCYKNHEKCHESHSKLGWNIYITGFFILSPGYAFAKILCFYIEHAVHVVLIRDCLLACLSAYI